MAGIVEQTRELHNGDYHGLYTSATSGGILDVNVHSLVHRQLTRSFRSGPAYGSVIRNPQELLQANELKNRYPYDTGHEFLTRKTTLKLSHPNYEMRSPYNNSYYKGPVFAFADPGSWYSYGDLALPGIDANARGTTAMAIRRPAKSAANLAQALSELLIDLPTLPFNGLDKSLFNKKNLPKNIGSEYLNGVFGVMPTINDVLKIANAVVNSQRILTQYMRDVGRSIRRSYVWEPEKTSSYEVRPRDYLGFPYIFGSQGDLFRKSDGSNHAPAGGDVTNMMETELKVWFSSAWSYWLDADSDLFSNMRTYAQLAEKLLGTNLDIELLWELAPWSWLIDWYTNIGDIVSINSALANDNLVMRHGYVSFHRMARFTTIHSGMPFGNFGHTGPVSTSIETKEFQRVRATPYGFGIDLSSLSAGQWAILAALGMTSGNNSLRY
jgi:hypothetical protein